MSTYKKPNATYVASVRCDLRDVASIALFFNNKGETLPTQTALINTGVKMMGQFFQSRFPVRSYSEAIATLRNLGYGDPLEKGTRYFRGLLKELGKEELANMSREMQSSADRASPAPNSKEDVKEKYNMIQDIIQKDQLAKPRLPTKESIEEADVVIKNDQTGMSQEEIKAEVERLKPKYDKQAEEVAGGIPGTKESSEEPQTPVDLSKKPTQMTQEDIDAANAKNARDTADMRKGLKAGIVASDK